MVSLKEKKHHFLNKETSMTSIIDSSVSIHPPAELAPYPPPCFGEVVLIATHLRQHDVQAKIAERVRFARRRFGRYEGAT